MSRWKHYTILLVILGSGHGCFLLPHLDRTLQDFSLLRLFGMHNSQELPTLGGTVQGLVGEGLTLNLELRTPSSVWNTPITIRSNGNFLFPGYPAVGAQFSVTITSQPTNPTQVCTVGGGLGTMGTISNHSIFVQCGDSLPLAMPLFSPNPGEYSNPFSVSITHSEPSVSILYTVDGTNPACPGIGSPYAGPISIPQPTIPGMEIRTIACLEDRSSPVQIGIFRVTMGQLGLPSSSLPTNPPAPNYVGAQTATLSPPASHPTATVHYTTDGSTPTCGSPSSPNPVSVFYSQTIQAIACFPDWTPSPIASFPYTITGTVATPSVSHNGGIYQDSLLVSLSTATPGAQIRYVVTTDGSDPNPSCADALYSGAIPISTTNSKIAAIGCMVDWTPSPISPIQTYTLNVASPVLSPAPPYAVTGSQTVSAVTATSSATIHYTIDGSEPTTASPTAAPLIVADATETVVTVRARAFRTGFNPSLIVNGTYTKTGTLTPPSFSPVAGTYPSAQSVSLLPGIGNPAGTEIRYRTDGVPATCSDALYSTALNVSTSQVLTAISCRTTPAWNPSSSVSGSFTITGTIATPVFTPDPASVANDTLSVNITTTTPGATIYYNFAVGSNPANPTCGSGSTTLPLIVDKNDTRIRAIACLAGWTDSSLAVATYTLRPDTPTHSVAPGTFGNAVTVNFTSSVGATLRVVEGDLFSPPPDPTCVDAVNSSVTIPSGSGVRTVKAIACRTDFAPSSMFSGVYTVNSPVVAPTISGTLDQANRVTITSSGIPAGQSLCYTLDGSDPQCSSTGGGAPNPLGQTCAGFSTPYVGVFVLPSSATVRARGCALNHENSAITQQSFTIAGTVGAVNADPGGGTVNNDPTITLTATSATHIYYRTNGTNPDCTGAGSTHYSTPFSMPPATVGSTSLRAIACAPGMTASAVATLEYSYVVAPVTTASTDGTKTNDETVTLATTTTGATIRYSLDYVTPNCGTGTDFSGSIELPTAATNPNVGLRAIGCKTNYVATPSALSRDYFFETALVAHVLVGTGETIATNHTSEPISIMLSSGTTGSKICIRTDGTSSSCDGFTGNCAADSTELGPNNSVYHWPSSVNTVLSPRACKQYYNQNPGTTNRTLTPTLPHAKRIFVTSTTHTGGFGGVTGADDICNADPNRPYIAGTYKALIAQTDVRRPPASTSLDWVLLANQTYIRPDLARTIVFTTDSASNPPNTFVNTISTSTSSVWTGFLTTGGAGVGPLTLGTQTCVDWTDGTAGQAGRYGSLTNSDLRALDVFTTAGACSAFARLVCVEQ